MKRLLARWLVSIIALVAAALPLAMARQPLWSIGGWVALLDDEEAARQAMEETGGKFDGCGMWEDMCYNQGPLLSPALFETMMVPRYKRIGAKLKAAGIDLWYTDCDGDVRPLIPGFLEAGINCLFPYEVNSCIHPARLLEQFGRDHCLPASRRVLPTQHGPDDQRNRQQGQQPGGSQEMKQLPGHQPGASPAPLRRRRSAMKACHSMYAKNVMVTTRAKPSGQKYSSRSGR